MLYLLYILVLLRTALTQNPDGEVCLSGGGIEIRVKDFSGLQEVGVHYDVNKPLAGAAGADSNYEITHKTGSYWVHKNPNVHVKVGDTVNYWLYFKVNGQGRTKTDLHATVGSSCSGGSSGTHTGTGTGTHTGTGTGTHTGTSTGTNLGNMKFIFSDDFSSGTIDSSKWKQEVSAFGGGNWEFQVYTPDKENTYIRNGVLYMKPTLTADKFGNDFLYHGVLDVQKQWGTCTDSRWYGCKRDAKDALIPPILSSKLISLVDFKYGRVEIVAKMPEGDWIWPAIWLMPKSFVYGGWPASGEIDMVEARCNLHYGNIGVQRVMSTLHWGPNPGSDSWPKTTQGKYASGGTWADDFHTYTLDWDASGIVISVDGDAILNRTTPSNGYGGFSGINPWAGHGKDAPFDQEFHFQMNVAVGGTLGFFPDNVQNSPYPKPWCNTCPTAGQSNKAFWEAKDQWYPTWKGEKAAMAVKSVKIWSH
ncbi:beta-1,3-glucan-binding protein-like isoform X2 [Haliotis rufescens]|uniref:beta-1,3-glucan-binding protein-like isoform X2 n=1 Tax=Haliotis rufescens TaxID=6454 RepID=UPI00201F1530|nr:beta-1,3-glucan-binding protein-like isoform X2 [Haliotis rufescens]